MRAVLSLLLVLTVILIPSNSNGDNLGGLSAAQESPVTADAATSSQEARTKMALLRLVHACRPIPPSWNFTRYLKDWAGVSEVVIGPRNSSTPAVVLYDLYIGPTAPETTGYFISGTLNITSTSSIVLSTTTNSSKKSTLQEGSTEVSSLFGKAALKSIRLSGFSNISLYPREIFPRVSSSSFDSTSPESIGFEFIVDACTQMDLFVSKNASLFQEANVREYFSPPTSAPLFTLDFGGAVGVKRIRIQNCAIGGTVALEKTSLKIWDGLEELTFNSNGFTGSLYLPLEITSPSSSGPSSSTSGSSSPSRILDFSGNRFGSWIVPFGLELPPPAVVQVDPSVPTVRLDSKLEYGYNKQLTATTPTCRTDEYIFTETGQKVKIMSTLSLRNVGETLASERLENVDNIKVFNQSRYFVLSSPWGTCVGQPESALYYAGRSSSAIISSSWTSATALSPCLFSPTRRYLTKPPVPGNEYASSNASQEKVFLGQYIEVNPQENSFGLAVAVTSPLPHSSTTSAVQQVSFSNWNCGVAPSYMNGYFSLGGNFPELEFMMMELSDDTFSVILFETLTLVNVTSNVSNGVKVCVHDVSLMVPDIFNETVLTTTTAAKDGEADDSDFYDVLNSFTALSDFIECFPHGSFISPYSLLFSGNLSMRVEKPGGNLWRGKRVSVVGPNGSIRGSFTSRNTLWPIPQGVYKGFVDAWQVELQVFENRTGQLRSLQTEESGRLCHLPFILLYMDSNEESVGDNGHSAFELANVSLISDFAGECFPRRSDGQIWSVRKILCKAGLDTVNSTYCRNYLDASLMIESSFPDETNSSSRSMSLPAAASETVKMHGTTKNALPIPTGTQLCGAFGPFGEANVKVTFGETTISVATTNFSFGHWMEDDCQVEGVVWYDTTTFYVNPGALRHLPPCFPSRVFGELDLPFASGQYSLSTGNEGSILIIFDGSNKPLRLSSSSCPTLPSSFAGQCSASPQWSLLAEMSIMNDEETGLKTNQSEEALEEPSWKLEPFFTTTYLLRDKVNGALAGLLPNFVSFADPQKCMPWSHWSIQELIYEREIVILEAQTETSSGYGSENKNASDTTTRVRPVVDPNPCYRSLATVNPKVRPEEEFKACSLTQMNCSSLAKIIVDTASCLLLRGLEPTDFMEYPHLPEGFRKTFPYFVHNSSNSSGHSKCSDSFMGADRLERALIFANTPSAELEVATQCPRYGKEWRGLLNHSDGFLVACLNGSGQSLNSPLIIAGSQESSAVALPLAVCCSPCKLLFTSSAIGYSYSLVILMFGSFLSAIVGWIAQAVDRRYRHIFLKIRVAFVASVLPLSVEQKRHYLQFLLNEADPVVISKLDLYEHCEHLSNMVTEYELNGLAEEQKLLSTKDRLATRLFVRTLHLALGETGRLCPLETLDQIVEETVTPQNALWENLLDLKKTCSSNVKSYYLEERASRPSGDPVTKGRPSGKDSHNIPLLDEASAVEMSLRSSHDSGSGSSDGSDDEREISDMNEGEHGRWKELYLSDEETENFAEKWAPKISSSNPYVLLCRKLPGYSSLVFIHLDQWTNKILQPTSWFINFQLFLLLWYIFFFVLMPIFSGGTVFASFTENKYTKILVLSWVVSSRNLAPGIIAGVYFSEFRRRSIEKGHLSFRQRLGRYISIFTSNLQAFMAFLVVLPALVTILIPGAIIFAPVTLTLVLLWVCVNKILICAPAPTTVRHVSKNGNRVERRVKILSRNTILRFTAALFCRASHIFLLNIAFQILGTYFILFFFRESFPWFAEPLTSDPTLTDLDATNVVWSEDTFTRYFEVMLVDFNRRSWDCSASQDGSQGVNVGQTVSSVIHILFLAG